MDFFHDIAFTVPEERSSMIRHYYACLERHYSASSVPTFTVHSHYFTNNLEEAKKNRFW